VCDAGQIICAADWQELARAVEPLLDDDLTAR